MPPSHAATAWRDRIRFARRFVLAPRTVGSLVPSSSRLAAAVASAVRPPKKPARNLTVVELGAGTGAFTRDILTRLRPGDRFMAVEIDAEFVATLRRRWPRIDVVCASAEQLVAFIREYDLGHVDHIVSGLPFATLPAGVTQRIVDAVSQSLRAGGTFSTFHYLHSYRVPAATKFRRLMTDALAATPTTSRVLWNFPPAVVVRWTKGTSDKK